MEKPSYTLCQYGRCDTFRATQPALKLPAAPKIGCVTFYLPGADPATPRHRPRIYTLGDKDKVILDKIVASGVNILLVQSPPQCICSDTLTYLGKSGVVVMSIDGYAVSLVTRFLPELGVVQSINDFSERELVQVDSSQTDGAHNVLIMSKRPDATTTQQMLIRGCVEFDRHSVKALIESLGLQEGTTTANTTTDVASDSACSACGQIYHPKCTASQLPTVCSDACFMDGVPVIRIPYQGPTPSTVPVDLCEKILESCSDSDKKRIPWNAQELCNRINALIKINGHRTHGVVPSDNIGHGEHDLQMRNLYLPQPTGRAAASSGIRITPRSYIRQAKLIRSLCPIFTLTELVIKQRGATAATGSTPTVTGIYLAIVDQVPQHPVRRRSTGQPVMPLAVTAYMTLLDAVRTGQIQMSLTQLPKHVALRIDAGTRLLTSKK